MGSCLRIAPPEAAAARLLVFWGEPSEMCRGACPAARVTTSRSPVPGWHGGGGALQVRKRASWARDIGRWPRRVKRGPPLAPTPAHALALVQITKTTPQGRINHAQTHVAHPGARRRAHPRLDGTRRRMDRHL